MTARTLLLPRYGQTFNHRTSVEIRLGEELSADIGLFHWHETRVSPICHTEASEHQSGRGALLRVPHITSHVTHITTLA